MNMSETRIPADNTDTEQSATKRIEKIAAEFDIWRDGEESDADLADRTIASLEASLEEIADYIDELRLLFAECP